MDNILKYIQKKRNEEENKPQPIEEHNQFAIGLYAEIEEAQRRQTLEDNYTRLKRQFFLKIKEYEDTANLIKQRKTKKRQQDIEFIYSEILEIDQKAQEILKKIKEYRTPTDEEITRGFN